MGQQINVNIRMDSEVKEKADALFASFGFNLTTAVNAFVRQSLREQAIPFQIRATGQPKPRAELKEIIKSIQEDSVANETDNFTLEEINEIIAESRRERKAKK
jgi:DNA-damage-inducible protein J